MIYVVMIPNRSKLSKLGFFRMMKKANFNKKQPSLFYRLSLHLKLMLRVKSELTKDKYLVILTSTSTNTSTKLALTRTMILRYFFCRMKGSPVVDDIKLFLEEI